MAGWEDYRQRVGERWCDPCEVGGTDQECWHCGGPTVSRPHTWMKGSYSFRPSMDDPDLDADLRERTKVG